MGVGMNEVYILVGIVELVGLCCNLIFDVFV